MKKILIVDRYPSVRELLAEDLAAEGNTVVPIGNPELIHSLIYSFAPNLIILDPFIDGKWQWNLLEKIKKQNPALPVLIFSADHPQGDRWRPLADGWVRKSFIFDELKEKINRITDDPLGRSYSADHLTPGSAGAQTHEETS